MAEAEDVPTTDEIPQWKREEVEAIADLIAAYDTVGVVGVAGIPSRQLQDMRASLHGRAALRVSRNTLVRRALDEVGGGVETLGEQVTGQVGLVVSDENPFSLYRTLEETKTPAPINAGEIAPNDIVVPEGDTGMDPGPFVGDLQQVGADARIQEGSIHVLSDSVVAEAGDEVSNDLAAVLAELDIEPKEVGLDLRAVFADGVRFEPAELELDLDAYRADFEAAAGRARGLSVGAAYPTRRTAGALLARGAGEARAVGVAGAVESPDLAADLVGRADATLRALASRIHDDEALPEELRGATEDAEEPTAEPDDTEADDADAGAEADDADAGGEADESDDDDDDDAGAEGLGEMFG